MDLGALLDRADLEAVSEARAALALVTQRGYERERDLLSALAAAVREFHR